MKKFLFLPVLLLVAWAVADVSKLKSSKPIIIPSEASRVFDPKGYLLAERLFDDILPAGNDTLAGPVIDIRNLQLDKMARFDSVFQSDSALGFAHISCYDASDSLGATDSVNVKAWVRGYDYASDNVDPLAPFGPTPFLAGDSTEVITAISNSNARKDTTYKFILKGQSTKATPFIRVVFRNISTAAQNKPRCRFFLYRKRAAFAGD